MKKTMVLLLLFSMFLLTSCFSENETFKTNKKVLDDNYKVNTNYGVITGRTYKTHDKVIDFEKLINKQITKDGKDVEVIYNTRMESTLVENKIYFFYEYKRVENIGRFAVGYVDLDTLLVYADYFEHDRRGYSWDYQFSTDKFVVYKFYGSKNIDIVFFKDTNQLEFNYNLYKLEYEQKDLEEVQEKEYYIENGIKYKLDWNKLINTQTGEVITLPSGNELIDQIPLIKEIYDKFTYSDLGIAALYVSNGTELFFYISDRPTNELNAPFMLFKCNVDLSEVTYIGYYDSTIFNVINLTNK